MHIQRLALSAHKSNKIWNETVQYSISLPFIRETLQKLVNLSVNHQQRELFNCRNSENWFASERNETVSWLDQFLTYFQTVLYFLKRVTQLLHLKDIICVFKYTNDCSIFVLKIKQTSLNSFIKTPLCNICHKRHLFSTK